MVCVAEGDAIMATIKNTVDGGSSHKQFSVQLTSSKMVMNVFKEVAGKFNYQHDSFDLILQKTGGDTVSYLEDIFDSFVCFYYFTNYFILLL